MFTLGAVWSHLKTIVVALSLSLPAACVAGASLTACDKSADKDEPSDDDDGASKRKKKKRKKKGGSSGSFEAGEEIAVQLKLAAADASDVACAVETSFGDLQCAFSSPTKKSDIDSTDARTNRNLLQPFTTVDGRKLLVGGIWSQPDVKAQIDTTKDRFLATCILKLVAEAEGAHVRTFPTAPWSEVEAPWVARADRCTVSAEAAPAPPPVPVPNTPPPPTVVSTRTYVPTASYTPRIGPEHAKVTIMFFTDVQCPYCQRVSPTLVQVAKDNKKTVALHLRHFPLAFHKEAKAAALAIQAAEKQGQGWALHDLLSKNNRALAGGGIDTFATTLGLNMTSFKSAVTSPAIIKQVDDDIALGKSSGVRGTPTILINGEKHSGGRTAADFQKKVDAEVLRADALLAKGTPKPKLYEELCK